MKIEVNKIEEIHKGHYQLILDFPSPMILYKIIDPHYKYIWGYNHVAFSLDWSTHDYSLFGTEIENLSQRNVRMEYLLETDRFLELIPSIHETVSIIQTNVIPPYYIRLDELQGKSRYDLLKDKVDYLFEITIPGAADYAPVVSSDREYLKKIIHDLDCK